MAHRTELHRWVLLAVLLAAALLAVLFTQWTSVAVPRVAPRDQAHTTRSPELAGCGGAHVNYPAWYTQCHVRGPFCDLLLNVKDELNYESRWAWEFLNTLSQERIDLFIGFFERLRQHVIARNIQGCPNMHSWDKFEAHLRKHINISDAELRSGRSAANYVNSVFVGFQTLKNSIAHAKATEPSCSWVSGQFGWGDFGMGLQGLIKGHNGKDPNKFMWSQKKGRGVPEDKEAMVLGIERSIVTKGMGQKFESYFQEHKGEEARYYYMPMENQRLLPGNIRWAQTYKHKNFGIFAYGDGQDWVDDTRGYFFERIIHGMGIFGRNLTLTNPADRMLHVGMPWIGGVSGSAVDMYIAARLLGYGGKELADLLLVDVACLVAGGQHSLGELIFALAEADDFGGNLSFSRGGVEDFTYFSFPQSRKLVEIMNKPEDEWQAERQELKDQGGLPSVYEAMLDEFIRRVGPSGFKRDEKNERGKMAGSAKMPALRRCVRMPASMIVALAVYERGGPSRAYKHWSDDGISGENDGISPAEFVTKMRLRSGGRWIVYAEKAFKEISFISGTSRDGHATITRAAFEAYVDNMVVDAKQIKRGPPSLKKLMWLMKPRIMTALWGGNGDEDGERDASDFALAFFQAHDEAVMEVHQCVVVATGSADDAIQQDALTALYDMTWLAAIGEEC